MIELRKTKHRHRMNIYKNNPVIRIAKATQARFIVSKLIADELNINTETEAIMFGLKDKKLHIWKEKKENDNYHLAKADANTYRFRNLELYDFVSDFFKVAKDKVFIIEMQKDKTFKLL
jgi:hypothetical protein